MNVYQKYKDAALEWVNDVRDAEGLPTIAELPSGHRRSGTGCVIARALSGVRQDGTVLQASVGVSSWCWAHDLRRYEPLGTWAKEFIMHFDAGNYPELIA